MISYLRRHRKTLFIGMVAIFLIGTFVGLGGYLFTSADMSEAVAVVGSTKIPYLRYQARVNQYLDAYRDQKKADITDDIANRVRQEMLRDMIVDELLYQQAEKLGLRVTDLEVAANVRNTPAFQRDGKFDQATYFQVVRFHFRVSPEDYERQQRQAMMSAKLKQLIYQSAKILPGELREEYRRANKGSDKDFEKNEEQFAAALQQQRGLDAINFYLKQLTGQVEIRSFLDQREKGA